MVTWRKPPGDPSYKRNGLSLRRRGDRWRRDAERSDGKETWRRIKGEWSLGVWRQPSWHGTGFWTITIGKFVPHLLSVSKHPVYTRTGDVPRDLGCSAVDLGYMTVRESWWPKNHWVIIYDHIYIWEWKCLLYVVLILIEMSMVLILIPSRELSNYIQKKTLNYFVCILFWHMCCVFAPLLLLSWSPTRGLSWFESIAGWCVTLNYNCWTVLHI